MYTGWLVKVHLPPSVSQNALSAHCSLSAHAPARAIWQTPMSVSQ